MLGMYMYARRMMNGLSPPSARCVGLASVAAWSGRCRLDRNSLGSGGRHDGGRGSFAILRRFEALCRVNEVTLPKHRALQARLTSL